MNRYLHRSALIIGIALACGSAFAQNVKAPKLAPDQSLGYGANHLTTFTYTQVSTAWISPKVTSTSTESRRHPIRPNFRFPFAKPVSSRRLTRPDSPSAASIPPSPCMFWFPCFPWTTTRIPTTPSRVPASWKARTAGPHWAALDGLFGSLPEAFKATPLVYTQCPDPGLPAGTCTMHTSRLDLGLLLVQLGFLQPPAANFFRSRRPTTVTLSLMRT